MTPLACIVCGTEGIPPPPGLPRIVCGVLPPPPAPASAAPPVEGVALVPLPGPPGENGSTSGMSWSTTNW